jgi:dephospho-CoA kinase
MTGIVHWGLTGGIGSGKSTVAALLQEAGAHVIDTDALSRQLTAPGGQAIAAIAQQFGAAFITPEGALDRARMRAHVFESPLARRQLETIVHPLIAQATARARAQALAQHARCVVYDVPLLVESLRWRQQVQRVLVVDCCASTQLTRVMTRSGLSEAQIHAIMATQASREQRLACADGVICNDGITLDQLRSQIQALRPALGL